MCCFFFVFEIFVLIQTLATAVAQILQGYNGTWRKQACGVFCFVKDYDNRSYCFRLYDLKVNILDI